MGRLALLFAGQGAQFPSMGRDLYEHNPAAKAVFDRCEALRPGTLAQCFTGDAGTLMQTVNTQPCLFAMDLACARALEAEGIAVGGVAGFSLGEVAALAFAGLLREEDAFRLVIQRAQAMHDCAQAHPGAMCAVLRLDEEKVEALCGQFPGIYPVNYNCPGQVACAGAAEQMEAFEAAVAAAGGRTMRLQVSGAFHSPYMAAAEKVLAAALENLPADPGRMPVYCNVNAQPYGTLTQLLPQQLRSPVRWRQTIENLRAAGYTAFVEVGAGKTLTGLNRKIDRNLTALHVQDSESLAATAAKLKEEGYAQG